MKNFICEIVIGEITIRFGGDADRVEEELPGGGTRPAWLRPFRRRSALKRMSVKNGHWMN